MLPILSADDIGNPAHPGEYFVKGITFQVERKHIETWQRSPETLFHTIKQSRINDDRRRLILGGEAPA